MLAGTKNLRLHLRESTAPAHDRLDAAMRARADWETREGYSRFLAMQWSARHSVENWLDAHAPPALRAPKQTALIEADLAALGAPVTPLAPRFVHEAHGKAAALGIVWALAGSSLGNRAILKDVRRAAPDGAQWPSSFLADDAMLAFWSTLRRQIERPANADEAEAARRSASALFEHFTAAVTARAGTQAELAA